MEETQFSIVDLKLLTKFTLARVMTFNARRGGEVSKLKLNHWTGVIDGRWKRRMDLEALDDPVEKVLAERLEICSVGEERTWVKIRLSPNSFHCRDRASN